MYPQNPLKAAPLIVDYYQRLADTEGPQWLLGLFMAKHWLALLRAETVDKEEVLLFVQTLEAEKMKQGSGWLDLFIRVRIWADGLE